METHVPSVAAKTMHVKEVALQTCERGCACCSCVARTSFLSGHDCPNLCSGHGDCTSKIGATAGAPTSFMTRTGSAGTAR